MSENKESGRTLGLFYTVVIGLNGAIGTGIFILLDYATFLAGPSVIIAILLCGLLTSLIMLSYCELGTLIPEIGGDYTFSRVAFGGFPAFITGWLLLIGYALNAALASIGFAHFLSFFIPLNIQLTALIVVGLSALISIRGMRKIEAIAVFAFVAIFLIFISGGIIRGVRAEAFSNLMPHGLGGILSATIFLYNIFFGLKAIIASGSRIRDPEKNIPRGIFLSTIFLTMLYFGIAYVAVGVVSQDSAVPGSLLTQAAEAVMGNLGGIIIAVAGLFASFMTLGTSLMIQTTMLVALSRDRYLPGIFLSSHKRFGTYHFSIIFGTVLTGIFAYVGVVEIIGYASSFAALLGYIMVTLSLIKLRREHPYVKRPFSVFLYPYTPIIGVAIALLLLFLVESLSMIVGLVLVTIGLMIYFVGMIGYLRFRIAVGGVNVAIGLISILWAFLDGEKLYGWVESAYTATLILYTLYFIGAVSILCGLINVTAKD